MFAVLMCNGLLGGNPFNAVCLQYKYAEEMSII